MTPKINFSSPSAIVDFCLMSQGKGIMLMFGFIGHQKSSSCPLISILVFLIIKITNIQTHGTRKTAPIQKHAILRFGDQDGGRVPPHGNGSGRGQNLQPILAPTPKGHSPPQAPKVHSQNSRCLLLDGQRRQFSGKTHRRQN